MRRYFFGMSAVLSVIASTSLFAANVDDAIKLTESGVADEIILAWAEAQPAEPITSSDIIRMKDAKVSPKMIVALIRNQNRAAVIPASQRERSRNSPAFGEQDMVRSETPVERNTEPSVRYVSQPSVRYVQPAVTYVEPAYYSGYSPYYSSSYYPYSNSSYYPYYGSSSLSLSFGSGHRHHRHYGSGYYGSGYGSGYGHHGYSSGHGSGYGHHGYRSGSSGHRGGGSYGYTSGSSGRGFSTSFRGGSSGSHRGGHRH